MTENTTSRKTNLITPGSLWLRRLQSDFKSFCQSWALFAENKIGLLGLGFIFIFALMAIAHPILLRTIWEPRIYDPITGYDFETLIHPSGPSVRHLLGTDPLGRDVLSQLMYSARSEFALGLLSALITVFIATVVGAYSAYYGGALDMLFMRLADLLNILPFIALLIFLNALFDFGLIHLAVVIGLLSGFGGATIIFKAQALTIKVKPYIEAARVAGGGDFHIIFKHIVPNLLPLAFLNMMFTVTNAVFSEAVLSFFGLLNLRMSWGIMIKTAQSEGYLLSGWQYWYLLVPAGLSITLLCSSFYFVGRALDELINPRLREH